MIKHRHFIPLAFALLALFLGVTGSMMRGRTKVRAVQVPLVQVGQTSAIGGLELKQGVVYHLSMTPQYSVPLDQSASVSATLSNASDEAEVFSVEDAYWHQAGVWREGGESGRWEEANIVTAFDFKVPEDGVFDLDVQLLSNSMQSLPLVVVVESSQPFPLAEFPMYFSAIFFLGIAGFVWWRRDRTMVDYIKTLGYGTKVELEGEPHTVTRIYDYGYGFDATSGVELELTNDAGVKRHIAVGTFESYWEGGDGNEHTRYFHRVMRDRPLSDDVVEGLERQWASSPNGVFLGNTSYRHDSDNSGGGTLTDWRGGKPARIKYFADYYRSHDGLGFPKSVGDLWLQRIRYGTDEHEWALMEIVDWSTINVLDAKPRPTDLSNVS